MLGSFSLSLTVSDIEKSKIFYEILGFEVFHGVIEEKWLIMKNGTTVIGLFEGMFDKNMMTFNPGWDSDANPLDPFEDVRLMQKRLRDAGVEFVTEVDEATEGPGSFMILDPDGNPILFDQHR